MHLMKSVLSHTYMLLITYLYLTCPMCFSDITYATSYVLYMLNIQCALYPYKLFYYYNSSQ